MVKAFRNDTYYGPYRNFTIPLRFVLDAAKILRTLVYTAGMETNIYLTIEKFNLDTYKYELWYKGEIDLSKMKDSTDYFDVNIAEGGFMKALKANEDVEQEIPIGNDAQTVIIDGIELKQSTNSLVQGSQDILNYVAGQLPAFTIISSEGTQVGTDAKTTAFHWITTDANSAIIGTNDPVYKATVAGNLIINNDWSFKTGYDAQDNPLADPATRVKVDIRVFSGGVIAQTINIYSSDKLGYYDNYGRVLQLHNVTGEYTIPLNIADEVYIIVYVTPLHLPDEVFGGGELVHVFWTDFQDQTFTPGTVTFGVYTKYPETYHLGYPAGVFYKKLGAAAFGADYNFISSILDPVQVGTQYRSLFITSGNGVRRIPNSKIKSKFKDFFAAMNVIKNLGMYNLGNNVFLESKKECFTGNIVADLGQVKDLQVSFAAQHLFNTIKIGVANKDYDDVNGKNEIHTTFNWTTPITRVVAELNLVSPYRWDSYGWEYTRINLDGKNTTDNEADNDVFIMDCIGEKDQTGHIIWRPFRQVFVQVNGVLAPNSLYNISLSPGRCLREH